MIMVCLWCRTEYDGDPLYHVCPDGATYDIRRNRTWGETEREYQRQDNVRDSAKDPNKLPLTSWDIEFLKGCRIKS